MAGQLMLACASSLSGAPTSRFKVLSSGDGYEGYFVLRSDLQIELQYGKNRSITGAISDLPSQSLRSFQQRDKQVTRAMQTWSSYTFKVPFAVPMRVSENYVKWLLTGIVLAEPC